MKVIKRIDKTKTYKDRNGKEHPSINYYLELDNRKWIAIRPSFYQDCKLLDVVCETITNE